MDQRPFKMMSVPDLVPARMLNQFTYCPRLGYFEWVQGEFEENAHTLRGSLEHRRVDQATGDLPTPESLGERKVSGQVRSVTLASENRHLVAKIDMLEFSGREVVPIDYKKGHAPAVGAWDGDRVQIAAQALILRDSGYPCNEGIIYYVASRKRTVIRIDDELAQKTMETVKRFRAVAASETIPPPLVDSPKCGGCSLAAICLPDETNVSNQSDSPSVSTEVRRFVPPVDYALPLYIQEQGARVGKRNEYLVVEKGGHLIQRVRLREVSQVCLFGNVGVTTQAIRSLMERDIPICYFSYGGWFSGMTRSLTHKNVELRLHQFRTATNSVRSLAIARQIVSGKIRNSRTLLRRNHPELPHSVYDDLSRLARKAERIGTIEALLGLEGAATSLYFRYFASMLRPKNSLGIFQFTKRNRRPPTDEVNALLSFAYAILARELTVIAQSIGLDPYLGVYHQPRYARPALALDMAEEYRSIICDSVVLTVINTGQITSKDFVRRGNAVALTSSGRKQFLAAYERRMGTTVTHPLYGYSVSYRRIMFVQARLMSRCFTGEIPAYRPFVTR